MTAQKKRTQIRDRVKELRHVRANEIKPHPQNWRYHTQAQTDALHGVMEEVGFAGAVIAYEDDGELIMIDGHLRARELSDDIVPVLVLDVNAAEAQKILATYDPLGAMAQADQDALLALLEVAEFESQAVNDMLEALANGETEPMPWEEPAEDPGPQIDRAEELQAKWGTEYGQLWQIGRHRLLCGDATSEADVARVLDGAKPLLMVTDPPYGVEYDANWRNEAAAKGQLAYAASRIGFVGNDDRADWGLAWSLSPADVAYTWSPGGDHVIITGTALQVEGFEIRNQIIWRKPHFPISRGHYTYQHEPCWYAVRRGKTAHWIGDASESSVWDISLDRNVEGGHSTQKPLECMARPIRNHEGDVYEPFCGSGTTMVAAEQLGRTCYAIEIEPRYVAVTLERMAGMGLTPELTHDAA